MFRDLRTHVSRGRRMAAWGILGFLAAVGLLLALLRGVDPRAVAGARLLLWVAGAFLAVRLFAYVLLDPLLSRSKTASPGFARDLVVVLLYFALGVVLLRQVAGVNLGAILGTGAIAAAVVGLSLQETLGNLFSGISMHLDPAFQVGDWVEVTGTLRGGAGRETFVGQVLAMTWRTVQLRTENGDMDIIPNRAIAQAVVTNLYVPSGFHRRTARITIEAHPELHRAVAALTQALGGIPHLPARKPEVVVHNFDGGGVALEMRWWALGYRHGRAGNYQAVRLAATVLPRLGFQFLGPAGPSTVPPRSHEMDDGTLERLLDQFRLPLHWAPELKSQVRLRRAAPGEGILREGDPGQSLFAVLQGSLEVVKVVEGTDPYTGLFWETRAVLEAGAWFGEASLLTGATCNATVVAATECELAELPKSAFEACIRREPQVLERLVDIMESRARSQEPLVAERREEHREQWLRQIRSWFRV